MAKITQASISLELKAMDVETAYDLVNITLTIEEAQSLYKLLDERFGNKNIDVTYPPGVRGYNMTPTDLMSQPLTTSGEVRNERL